MEQLNKARDAKWGITLTISKKTNADAYGSTKDDEKNKWDETKNQANIKIMHITLEEGKMKKDFKEIRNGIKNFTEYQGELYESLYKRNAFEPAFLANAGHEIEHAANGKNIQNSWRNFILVRTK
jgi:hypothetical protein